VNICDLHAHCFLRSKEGKSITHRLLYIWLPSNPNGYCRSRGYVIPPVQLVYLLYPNQKVRCSSRPLYPVCMFLELQLESILVFLQFNIVLEIPSSLQVGSCAGTGLNPFSLDVLAVFTYRVLQRTNHPVQASADYRTIS
jgi:hypothetical protein